jgi:hypothetical protein
MSKPINYYIQLSDELSTAIDGATKKELIEAATFFLNAHNYNQSGATTFQFNDRVAANIDTNDCLKLAHGLLAKAI